MSTYKIKIRELPHSATERDNILITAKNTDTLEEYSVKNFIEPDYLPKI